MPLINIRVPKLPGSVTTAKISNIHVKEGDFVELDGRLLDIETNKVVSEITAADCGVVEQLFVSLDDEVESEQTVGTLVPEPANSIRRLGAESQTSNDSTIDEKIRPASSNQSSGLGWLFITLATGAAILVLL